MGKLKYNPSDYEYWVSEYIKRSIDNNKAIPCDKLRFFNLPDSRWYVKYCPDASVDSWGKFVAWTGLFCESTSKERAIELLRQKEIELGRPLKYDDFRISGCYNVTIPYINKTWGSVNKMKKELGMEIIQEDMYEKSPSKDDFEDMLGDLLVCAGFDRITAIPSTYIDMHRNVIGVCYETLDKACQKYYNMTLKDHLEQIGFSMGKLGCGTVNQYEDGEVTQSIFETIFSNFLRENGYYYTFNYLRNERYSEIIDDYNGSMDCDYMLVSKDDQIVYVEIAGLIEAYKTNYYEDIPITSSKSKERYRLKLKKKEEMLSRCGDMYFILWPCDLTEENMMRIITSPTVSLRKEIESFHQNNIDWNNVSKLGKLDYSNDAVYRWKHLNIG